ncbi:MAG TPA: extracellular solute-binding protein [Candidatus Babeliales bacterium]|nr:extracellular solute-binding protein [Candidatus Babeliales bacterium]
MNFSFKSMIRISMIIFWSGVICLFLMVPRIFDLMSKKSTISVLTWPNIIDINRLKAFEREMGVRVYVNYFDSNEELLTKLRVAKEQYDLIIPSDFMVEQLTHLGLLKELDFEFSRSVLAHIEPQLLNNYFDPGNKYSIPCMWDIYGIAINKKYFDNRTPKPDWELIFDAKKTPKHVVMTNDPRELILVSSMYLFGSIYNLTEKKLVEIENLLLQQKKWVEAYTDLRADYLLASGASPVALLPLSYVLRSLGHYQNIDFLLPSKTFMLIDSFVIPKSSRNEKLTYDLIRFLLREEETIHNTTIHGFLPPQKNLLAKLDLPFLRGAKIPWHSLDFFKNVILPGRIMQIWRTLKAA